MSSKLSKMTLVDLFFSVKHQLHPFFVKSEGFRAPKGDLAERLGARVTVFMLSLLTAFCVTHFFWGKGQINCWLEHQDINDQWTQFINDYCYVQGTFFVPLEEPQPWKRPLERVYINYYQWAPYVFAIQGLLFYIPEVIWLKVFCGRVCGVDLTSLTAYVRDTWFYTKQDIPRLQNSFQEKTSVYMRNTLYLHHSRHKNYPSLTFCYLLSKFVNGATSCLAWYWLNEFLESPHYKFWGFAILRDMSAGLEWTQTGHFPRLTYCIDLRQRFGAPQTSLVKCALPMMAYYEKIFVFLWFWFGAMCVVNALSAIYWLCLTCCPAAGRKFVLAHLIPNLHIQNEEHRISYKVSEDKIRIIRFIEEDLRSDGLLLLRKICSDVGSLPTAYLLSELYANYIGNGAQSTPAMTSSTISPTNKTHVIFSGSRESKLAKTV